MGGAIRRGGYLSDARPRPWVPMSAMLFCGVSIEPRAAGTLWLPDTGTLVVSDLHLGKAERHARRSGRFWPPYDTAETLTRLEAEVAALSPVQVIALGDSFDDDRCADHLDEATRARLDAMVAARAWVWVTGNHDPAPTGLGGEAADAVTLGPLTFRHIAQEEESAEISGHYHPKASLRLRGKRVTRKCFLMDTSRLILPAFGTFTGGLDVFDVAFASLFDKDACVILTGSRALRVPLRHLRAMAA